jgi:hypothetical protein
MEQTENIFLHGSELPHSRLFFDIVVCRFGASWVSHAGARLACAVRPCAPVPFPAANS